MKRFATFNPEHDLALANGDAHYLAPCNIREMAHDLASLMDCIEWDTPWGWDAAIVSQLHKSGIPHQELPTDAMLAALRTRSERITAHHLLQQLVPLSDHFTGESRVCRSLDDIKAYATQYGHLLLKAPLSGSGKGLRHVKTHPNPPWEGGKSSPVESTSMSTPPPSQGGTGGISSWADALIRRHGYLTAEPYYTKMQDFAMEFFVSGTQCRFIGYSLFVTDRHGRYDGNLLMSDAKIEDLLATYIPRETLHKTAQWFITHYTDIIPPEWDTTRFPLHFGVDMMIVNNAGQQSIHSDGNSQLRTHDSTLKVLHPCVEVNLRMNMGIVAHEIHRQRLAPEAEGLYRIAIFTDTAALRAFSAEQATYHPAVYSNGLLTSGYLPLTPIEEGTRHHAYVICD